MVPKARSVIVRNSNRIKNRLTENLLSDVHLNFQFLCLRNIKLFLQACHESFGLKDSDLFEPQCLFDLTDFLRVLQTLSKLSLSLKFQRHNIS